MRISPCIDSKHERNITRGLFVLSLLTGVGCFVVGFFVPPVWVASGVMLGASLTAYNSISAMPVHSAEQARDSASVASTVSYELSVAAPTRPNTPSIPVLIFSSVSNVSATPETPETPPPPPVLAL